MNRFGIILNQKLALYEMMKQFVANFCGPLCQTIFPNVVSPTDCDDFHAFTVRYKEGEDVKLKLHQDTSIATMNVNLNASVQSFGGSDLYFYDKKEIKEKKLTANCKKHIVKFESGMALIHLGSQMHAALPITEGERTNLIVWMYRSA